MKFAGMFGKYLLAVALGIPSFASAQESPPDINASAPTLNDPALDPLMEAPAASEGTGAIAPPTAAPAPNAAAVELGEAKAPKKKAPKKSAKKEIKKSKKAEKKHKKDSKKAKKTNSKKKKKNHA